MLYGTVRCRTVGTRSHGGDFSKAGHHNQEPAGELLHLDTTRDMKMIAEYS